jgi:hypothetical protein
LIGVTYNFLFYKEIQACASLENKKNMDQIYNKLIQANLLTKQQKQLLSNRVEEKLKSKACFDKNADFLHPIMLYTSQYLYSRFNEFAR